MIVIEPDIILDESAIHYDFVRASGPGGQNVNKVSSAVQLRLDITASNLSVAIQQRLKQLAGKRLSAAGELIIHARRFRSQERNRQDALERLVKLVRQAAQKPRRRIATRPGLGAVQNRLQRKKRRGQLKKLRREDFKQEI